MSPELHRKEGPTYILHMEVRKLFFTTFGRDMFLAGWDREQKWQWIWRSFKNPSKRPMVWSILVRIASTIPSCDSTCFNSRWTCGCLIRSLNHQMVHSWWVEPILGPFQGKGNSSGKNAKMYTTIHQNHLSSIDKMNIQLLYQRRSWPPNDKDLT